MTGLLPDDELKACCAKLYESDAVLWLLDGELHPGGKRLTLRLAELAGIAPGQRANFALLDADLQVRDTWIDGRRENE